MMLKDFLELDHQSMFTDFGVECTNSRNSTVFNAIFQDAYVAIDDNGIPTIADAPMFHCLKSVDIKQYDEIVINNKSYIVREIKNDGIGGLDVYLKASNA